MRGKFGFLKILILMPLLLALLACRPPTGDDPFADNPGGSPGSNPGNDGGQPALPEMPSDVNLISLLSFDDSPSASVAADSVSSAIDASLTNMTLSDWVDDSEMGQVLRFTSANSTFVETGVDLRGDDAFTVAFYVKPEAGLTDGPRHLFWQGHADINGWGAGTSFNPSNHEFHISLNYFNSCASGITVYFGGTDAFDNSDCSDRSDNAMVADSETALGGSWIHVAAVVTGANSSEVTVKLYVNGSLVGSDTGSELDRSSWAGRAHLGKPGADQRYYDGLMDHVRVYAEELSDEDIAALALEKIL